MPDLNSIISERTSRFKELEIISYQKNHDIPQDVADLVWSRQLLPVITLGEEANTPFGSKAPIKGAAGMTMTLAVCPPGTGPLSHNHRQTFETFTVLQGSFRFLLGPESESSVILNQFDTISVPPGIYREFRNLDKKDGILQVIITGGIHDMNDIYFPRQTSEKIVAKGQGYLEYFKKIGLQFTDAE